MKPTAQSQISGVIVRTRNIQIKTTANAKERGQASVHIETTQVHVKDVLANSQNLTQNLVAMEDMC